MTHAALRPRFVCAALAVAFCFAAWTSAARAEPAVTRATASAAPKDTLKQVATSKTLRLGYREASIPFSYMNGDKAVGFSIDLCGLVAERIKSELGLARVSTVSDTKPVLVWPGAT